MNVTTLICFSLAMTASALLSNKAAYVAKKNGTCLCTRVREEWSRDMKVTKLVRARRRAPRFTLIRPVSLADAELALC